MTKMTSISEITVLVCTCKYFIRSVLCSCNPGFLCLCSQWLSETFSVFAGPSGPTRGLFKPHARACPRDFQLSVVLESSSGTAWVDCYWMEAAEFDRRAYCILHIRIPLLQLLVDLSCPLLSAICIIGRARG